MINLLGEEDKNSVTKEALIEVEYDMLIR